MAGGQAPDARAASDVMFHITSAITAAMWSALSRGREYPLKIVRGGSGGTSVDVAHEGREFTVSVALRGKGRE